MDMKIKLALLTVPILLNGCATTTRSTLLGAAIGGAAGGAIGQANSQNSQGTVIGLAVGAGLGSLIGYVAHKEKEKKEVKTEVKDLSGEDTFPALTKPKLRSIWVPDRVEGNKYIKGHWIYVIEDPGAWSR